MSEWDWEDANREGEWQVDIRTLYVYKSPFKNGGVIRAAKQLPAYTSHSSRPISLLRKHSRSRDIKFSIYECFA